MKFAEGTSGLGSKPELAEHLGSVADEHADRVKEAHRRARQGAKAGVAGLKVTVQKPVDVLSAQILLPSAGA